MLEEHKPCAFLKTFKLKGFKSFARLTTLHFSPGISVIVGPNGCGKSNLVDALKWVLGEQSFKSLRSKSAEDLIFSGSEKAPPLNMAEVSVVLEQHNASEIMLTRCVFRSGENRYLLNKKHCRLKDIKDVLLNMGFGLKNYAIVDQGQIAYLLEISPLEKRRLLEEAAGVTKYREKKEETLHKIQETKQNLLRIEDILGEVEKQVKKLSTQSKKAKKYLELKKNLEKVHLSLLLKSYQIKTDNICEKQKQIEVWKRERKEIEREYKLLLKQAETLRTSISTGEQTLGKYEQSYWEIKNEINQIKSVLISLDRQKDILNQQKQTIRKREADLHLAINQIKESCKEIEAETATLANKIEKTEVLINTINNEIAHLDQENNKKMPGLRSKSKILERNKAEMIKFKAEIEHLLGRRDSLIQEKQRVEKRQMQLENDQKQCLKELEEIEHKLGVLKSKIIDIKQVQEQVAQRCQKIRQKKYHWQKAIIKMEENLIRSQSRLKSIKLWLESHLPRQKMPADKDISSIMDIIINANGFEDAVEAVLRLKTGNGWLIKDFSNALKILRQSFLKEPFSLVLRDLPDPQSSLPQDPKKYLLSLIQIREGCLPLGKRLFGNVIVVQTLTQDLLNLHPNIIFVTPKGEILTSEGVIHKGYSQGILKEYLSQKKLYIHLQKKVGILKRHLSQVRTRFKTLKIELTQLEKLLKENEIEVEKYKKQQDGIKEEEIKQKEFLKYTFLQKEENQKRINEIIKNLESIQTTIQQRERRFKKAEKSRDALEEELRRLRKEVEEIKMLKGKKTQRLNEYILQNREMESKKRFFLQERKRLIMEQENLITRQRELREELKGIENQEMMLKKEQKEKKQRVIEADKKEKELLANINALKKEIKWLSQKERAITEKISLFQSKRQELSQKINLYELEVSKLTGEINILGDRLQKEYGILFSEDGLCPPLELSVEDLEDKRIELEGKLQAMSNINLGAIEEYKEVSERYNFLKNQRKDLKSSLKDLEKAIKTIDRTSVNLFLTTLQKVNEKFCSILQFVFRGAKGEITLLEPAHPLSSGVDFKVRLPGKKVTHHLLSMGERCLISLIFLFSLYSVRPSPFCILDEVDAGLDSQNLRCFCDLLLQLKNQMQLIVITHNRMTMQIANAIIGVTMEEKGISQVFSLSLNKEVRHAQMV